MDRGEPLQRQSMRVGITPEASTGARGCAGECGCARSNARPLQSSRNLGEGGRISARHNEAHQHHSAHRQREQRRLVQIQCSAYGINQRESLGTESAKPNQSRQSVLSTGPIFLMTGRSNQGLRRDRTRALRGLAHGDDYHGLLAVVPPSAQSRQSPPNRYTLTPLTSLCGLFGGKLLYNFQ